MLGWMDAATVVLGVRDIIIHMWVPCGCHALCTGQRSRVWKGLGRWRGGVVLVKVRAGGNHHTQIDAAPLLEDVRSFRIPDRRSPDRAPPLRAALRSLRGSRAPLSPQ